MLCLLLGAGSAGFIGDLARAQVAPGTTPKTANNLLPPELQPSIASSIPALAEFKKGLYDLGYNLQLDYFADGLSNPTGGVRQGVAYEGILGRRSREDRRDGRPQFSCQRISDTWRPAVGFQYLEPCVDSIEARPGTQLFELWVKQNINHMMSIRIGQLATDNQFFISEPAYPLATPGVRLKFNPNDHLALLAGVYNGDPSGAGFMDWKRLKTRRE